jgi:ABC-type phosphate transport system substrate-binding protein
MKSLILKLGLLGVMVCAVAIQASALENAVVIVNESVSAASLSADALKDIYTGKNMYWEGGQSVVIVVVNEKTDAAVEQASGMNASAFKTFWQRLAFSGRGQQPKKADDAAAAMALVSSTKGAIAIVPADTVLKGVKKLEIK